MILFVIVHDNMLSIELFLHNIKGVTRWNVLARQLKLWWNLFFLVWNVWAVSQIIELKTQKIHTRQISNSYFCIVIKTLLERIINRLNLYHETKKNFSGFGDERRSFFLRNDTGKD